MGAFVHAQIPGSRLVTLHATGHCPQLSAPEATAAAIAAFVGGPPMTSAPAARRRPGSEGNRGPAEAPTDAAFSALLEDSAEDLYEHAPCGYLSTLLDGRIVKINATLLDWLGYRRADLVGRRHFSDLLTVGGRLYHETHFAPLLRMQGEISGIALELKAADGSRLPVLVTSTVKTGAATGSRC